MMSHVHFIGIDVSKAKLGVSWLKDTQNFRYRSKVINVNSG